MGKKNRKRKINTKNNKCKTNTMEEVSVDNTGGAKQNATIAAINNTTDQAAATQNNISSAEELKKLLVRVSEELVALNLAKNAAEAMNIDESERIFFDRKVRPLIDSMYFLGLTSSSIIATGQAANSNQNGRRRDVKQALDLSSDINKEIGCIFKTFQKRMKLYRCGIEKQLGCCNGSCDKCDMSEAERE